MKFEPIPLGSFSVIKYGKMPQKDKISDNGRYPIFSGYRVTGYYDEFNIEDSELIVVARGVGGTGDVKLSPPHCYLTNLSIAVCVDENVALKRYLYYYFKMNSLRYLDSGSAQSQITISDLQKVEVPLPDISIQRSIVDILSVLDDKIEANIKINDNLMRQAQAIYIDRFITNADSTWPTGHLSDLVNVRYGKDHKKLADGHIPVYGSGGLMRRVERALYDKESVLIPRKGTLNNVLYVNEPFWSVDTMFYTEMRVPNAAKFVYHFVSSKDLASMNAGSAVPSMTTDILNAMELRIPAESTLAAFEGLVAPMYRAMQENRVQSEKLAIMRDTLLPRLMSGEIDVSDVTI